MLLFLKQKALSKNNPDSKFYIPNSKKGATLLELLIYIAVLVLVFVIIGETFTTIILTKKKIEAKREVTKNLDFAIKKIEQSIKEASAITGDYPADTLSLTIGGQTVSFGLSSGIFQETEGGSIYNITSDEVTVSAGSSNLFYKITNPSIDPTIQIKIKVRYNSNDPQLQNIETQAQTTISLR